MKTALNLLITLFLVGSMTAQEEATTAKKDKKQHKKEHFTPEQQATLKTKKMDLHLDLSEAQEKKVYQLVLENAKNRTAKKAEMKKAEKKERTTEEKYQMKLQKLDHMLAYQEQMKTILDDKQFDQWKQHAARRHGKKNRSHCKTKTAG